MINDFDITDIEDAVTGVVRGLGVSSHVWNNRPKATADDIDDFVVVKVTGGISDKAALGNTHVAIQLFARDVNEMKNKKRLSVMQKAIRSLPLAIGKYIIDGTPRIIGDTADDFGFHARIINFRVIIKSV